MNRRGFFKLAAGAAALVAVPYRGLSAGLPCLFADGVNCDAAGLTALFRDDVVRFHGSAFQVIDGQIDLAGPIFHIRSPIKLTSRSGALHVKNMHVKLLQDFEGEAAIIGQPYVQVRTGVDAPKWSDEA